MRSAISAFLVTLAVLTNLLIVIPAQAGMVSTPRPQPAEREAALERAARGLPGLESALRVLPTSDLLLLAGLPASQLRASNDALVALLVIGCVVVFVALIIVIVIIDRVRRHRRHLGAELEPAPAARTAE